MKRFLTRRRLVVLGVIALFVAAFVAIGAVSRSSPSTSSTAVTSAKTGALLPYAAWYWTMLVSPSNANLLLVGTNAGVLRSANGGKTWKTAGLTNLNTTSLAQVGSSIYAGGVVGPNPIARIGTGRVAPAGTAVLSVSTDDGKTWKTVHPSGLPKTTIEAMNIDPANPKALYVLLNTGGLYRSTDGARSFELVTSKIGIIPYAFTITNNGQFVGGDMDSGSHTSPNAKAWTATAFTDASGGHMVMEYAVQPSGASRVLMTSMGIEMSTDGGKTWHLVLKDGGNVMFGPVAYAPKSPQVAYAIGFDRSIWRSDDGGQTWSQIP